MKLLLLFKVKGQFGLRTNPKWPNGLLLKKVDSAISDWCQSFASLLLNVKDQDHIWSYDSLMWYL